MTDAAPAVAARSSDAPGQAIPSQATRTIALLVLFIVGTINYVDRQMIGVLKPTLAAELRINPSCLAGSTVRSAAPTRAAV